MKGLLALGARQDEARQLSLFDEPECWNLGGGLAFQGAGPAGVLDGEGEGRALSPAVRLLGTRETALAALTGEL